MLRKISLASLGIVVGSTMTATGIIAYFFENATVNLVGFSYGIPILLGGLAFKVTELKPIPTTQPSTAETIRLRETQATPTQKQVLKDITRYWYGQDAHLDVALKHVGLGSARREQPIVQGVYETVMDGSYALVLEFSSPMQSLEQWQDKQEKIEQFLGPGIRAQISQPREDEITLALISQPTLTEELTPV